MSTDDAAPKRRRRRVLIAIGAVLVLLAAAVGVFFATREGNVSNPNVEFREEPSPTPAETPSPGETGKGRKAPDPVWPLYGYGPERQRYLSVPPTLAPPFRQVWQRNGKALLEFPPVMQGKSLYLLSDFGRFMRLDKRNGRVVWERNLGTLAASTPALAGNRVFATVLERAEGAAGRIVAMNAKTGKILWSDDLDSRSESSPLVHDGRVFFGTENGTVYAVDQRDGDVDWTFRADGAVKGALALADGKLFFGDYAGAVYALDVDTGKQVWEAKTKGASFGLRSGRFYSTPAAANGRVFIGNVDGYVYSFAQSNGELAWRTKTGGYVYGAPAVGPGPGGEPTVFIGSYDGTFYAMDARSGAIKWTAGGFGRISGGSQILNDVVYFPDLGNRKTYGLDVETGKRVFDFRKGGFATVITDGKTLFLTGYGLIYALRPRNLAERRKELERARTAAQERRAQRRELAADCRKRFDRKTFAQRCLRNARVDRRRALCARRARDSKGSKKDRRRKFYRCAVRLNATR